MTEILAEQRSEAWREAHRGMITSSRIITIMNGGPRGIATLMQHMREELDGGELYFSDFEEGREPKAIAWGNLYEPIAVANLELDLDEDLERPGLIVHPTIPYLGASSDFLARGRTINGEVKCPLTMESHSRTYMNRAIPREYVPQVQLQMLCNGTGMTWFLSYHPEAPVLEMRSVLIEVLCDRGYQQQMIERCDKFMRALHGGDPVHREVAAGVPSFF